jgi:hypothetical protein
MKLDERYFTGGYDPEHPTGNVQFRLEDNEDGTGISYEYDIDGLTINEEAVTGLPLPSVEVPLEDQVVILETQIAELAGVLESMGSALGTITPTSTSTALRTALLNMRTVINSAIGG